MDCSMELLMDSMFEILMDRLTKFGKAKTLVP